MRLWEMKRATLMPFVTAGSGGPSVVGKQERKARRKAGKRAELCHRSELFTTHKQRGGNSPFARCLLLAILIDLVCQPSQVEEIL
jgi:hypothetical protein